MKNCVFLLYFFCSSVAVFTQNPMPNGLTRSLFVGNSSPQEIASLSFDSPKIWLWGSEFGLKLMDTRDKVDADSGNYWPYSVSTGPVNDPFDKQKWWLTFSGSRIGQIDSKTFETKRFQLGSGYFNALFFDEKTVWVGTTAGLYAFDRATGNFGLVGRSPNQPVKKLERGASGKLLVLMDDQQVKMSKTLFSYDPATACWNVEEKYRSIPVDSIQYWKEADGYSMVVLKRGYPVNLIDSLGNIRAIKSSNGKDTLGGTVSFGESFLGGSRDEKTFSDRTILWTTKGSFHPAIVKTDLKTAQQTYWKLPKVPYGSFKFAESPGEIWFADDHFLGCFSKKTGAQQVWERPLLGKILNTLAANESQIFLLFKDSLTVVNKDLLQKTPANGLLFFEKQAEFKRICDSIQLDREDDFAVKFAKIKFLKSRFQIEADPTFQQKINEALRQVSMPYSRENIAYLFDEQMGLMWDDRTFSDWSQSLSTKGNWAELEFLVKNAPPKFKSELEPDLNLILSRVQKMAELDKTEMPGDARLWAKSEEMSQIIHTKFFRSQGFGGGAWLGSNLVDSIYQKLLLEYPKSEWADDADFSSTIQKLSQESCTAPDYKYNRRILEAFLQRWPQSELRKKVDQMLVFQYYLGDSTEARTAMRHLETAKKTDDWAGYSSFRADDIVRAAARFDLKITASLKNSLIRVGDPVEIEVSVQNTGEFVLPCGLYLEDTIPAFSAFVRENYDDKNCVKPIQFVEGKSVYLDQRYLRIKYLQNPKVHIEPGGSKTVKIDLCKAVISMSSSPNLGHFTFEHTGEYEVTLNWILGRGQLETPLKFRIID